MDIPIRIRNPFTPSDALNRHIQRCLDQALRIHRRSVRRVEVHLADENGPRRGAADKITTIDIALRPFGEVLAQGRAPDLYLSVQKATARAKHALGRQAGRLLARRSARSRAEADR
jgi:ribosome-associated translation inhibitor RaiA